MTIQYLQVLRDNPERNGFNNRGISEVEITQLEVLYNAGSPFPKVLKEMLFLAGSFCNVLDFSVYDSQQEMQDEERIELLEIRGITIPRPHYFVDLSSDGMPLFMYLDEGDNPPLHQILNNPTQDNYSDGGGQRTLKTLIESSIQLHLDGYNPF